MGELTKFAVLFVPNLMLTYVVLAVVFGDLAWALLVSVALSLLVAGGLVSYSAMK